MPVQPSFFLCGAPRAGTTSLYAWLAQHPSLFLPELKEPQHFALELRVQSQRRERIDDRAEYEALYTHAKPGQLAGDGSTWHFLAPGAPARIREYCPEAKIILVLRQPAELVFSWHGLLREHGLEDLNFADALDAEADRRAGRRLPPHYAPLEGLFYREVAKFATTLQRFYDAFPREQIHVELYDHLQEEPAALAARVLNFLEVDAGALPPIERKNVRTTARSEGARQWMAQPPGWIQKPLRAATTPQTRRWLYQRLSQLNRGPAPSPPIPANLRAQLMAEWSGELIALEHLLNINLASWR